MVQPEKIVAAPAPTSSELKMMIMVLANQQNKAVIDWKALAPELGYANASVAQTRWAQIGRRLGFKSAQGSPRKAKAGNKIPVSGNMSSPATEAATPTKAGKKAAGVGVKKQGGKRGKASKAKKVESEEEQEEQEEQEEEAADEANNKDGEDGEDDEVMQHDSDDEV